MKWNSNHNSIITEYDFSNTLFGLEHYGYMIYQKPAYELNFRNAK